MKKQYDDTFSYGSKPQNTPLSKEQKAGGFRCSHCRNWVVINPYIGTANRNHCNMCLWSRHVDEHTGDRMATCRGGMQPVALTFKHEGYARMGEIMLVHQCMGCDKISINRIAGDDYNDKILAVFAQSLGASVELKKTVAAQRIAILEQDDEFEIRRQLFGV